MPNRRPPACAALTRLSPVRLFALLTWLAIVPALLPTAVARAQDELCFDAPAITACISGRFRDVWEGNGGLAVFGYPLTPARLETNSSGDTVLTQWFERARFELHPAYLPPYDVLLGRLGAERLQAQGEDWKALPRQQPVVGCQYWEATGFNVCGAFLERWRSAGLRADPSAPLDDAARLALWGLPITGERPRVGEGGIVLEQWFERARFELQPDGSLTIGLLGRELLAGVQPGAPAPAPAAPAPPAPEPPVPVAPPPAPSAPFPEVPCNANVPAPAEGLQLWMATPEPRGTEDAVACVRLILNGEVVRGAPAITYRYIGDARIASIPQSTGSDGVASFIFYVGDLPTGLRVPVEANLVYRGTTYVAWSAFTKR
ncbi:hypothetical protein [Kallotenue papyrolyticum]|uniref:hypothetical protein n=1 Tax=Kallotenue papyrolyticum TaxID=1325125 RepID=UPI0004B205C6|nr:hypothetical protein [Kallotenue papyrolyticum]